MTQGYNIFDIFFYRSKRCALVEEYEWEKKALRNFILVCKSWSQAVRKIRGGPNVFLEIYDETKLNILLEDIPYFGYEVNKLIFMTTTKIPEERKEC